MQHRTNLVALWRDAVPVVLLDNRECSSSELPCEPTPHRVDGLAAADFLSTGGRELLAIEDCNVYRAWVSHVAATRVLIQALARTRRMQQRSQRVRLSATEG